MKSVLSKYYIVKKTVAHQGWVKLSKARVDDLNVELLFVDYDLTSRL